MPWLVGIDEAGYGPNLGPLLMTAVACRVPERLAEADLWDVLAAAARRTGDKADGRPLIADSKVVHSGPRGLAALEQGVWAFALSRIESSKNLLADYLHHLAPEGLAELADERWYRGDTVLPHAAEHEFCKLAARNLNGSCLDNELELRLARVVVVCAARFNRIVTEFGSKGAVLAEGLTQLIRWMNDLPGDDAVSLVVDKHGGRNAYAPMLQEAVPTGTILAEREGLQRSVYRLLGGSRPMRFTFQPRADAEHFLVALASMVSKYFREVLMGEFNRYWIEQVPGLKPTAGYPTDAVRFREAIRPRMAALGYEESSLWRCK